MRIAMLAPIAWRVPPRHYGPWEQVVSALTEGLVDQGVDVTLFATADSNTGANLRAVCPRPYEEDKSLDVKVWESLHISQVFEQAQQFDIIHNHFDFLPLTYSGLVQTPVVTTIHGISSPTILPVYKKYKDSSYFVSISDSARLPELDYTATVYNGIDLSQFTLNTKPEDYLLYLGRIHPEKGVAEAIEIARQANRRLIIAGIVHAEEYFEKEVAPLLDGDKCSYIGNVGPVERDQLLGQAYALLYPVCNEEPFGLPVVEAQACGTPVIAFNRGAMGELIQAERTGFLVGDVEAAAACVGRVDQLSRAECRAHVEERFSQEQMAQGYLEVYRRIIEEQKRDDRRPWGYYEILTEGTGYKVKRITVYPGKRLSLQLHRHRSEHWEIVSGTGLVEVNGREQLLEPGECVHIPREGIHRVRNPGQDLLVFIEVQKGSYLGEDDIERLEDDFGRRENGFPGRGDKS